MGMSEIVAEPTSGRTERGGAGAVAGEGREGLDLFLRRRGAALIGSIGESGPQNGPIKNVNVGSATTGRSRLDDLLDAEMGKHDYDWLLTPPGTPIFPSSDASENQIMSTTTNNRSTVKSASTARASRLSASHLDNGHSTRPIRSSSVTRSSISSTYSNSISFNNRTSALNTSTASVTSRPSTPSRSYTPANRSVPVSSARSSAVSRPLHTRSANPAKTRPSLTSPGDKTRPLQNSRPSTPTGRSQHPSISGTNYNTSVVRSTSRPSTPTRRPTTPGLSSSPVATVGRFPSAGRLSASRNSGHCSRPSSPGSCPRAPVRPIDLPDFPLDVPPNLRTKLPERPASAGRTRPGMALTVKASLNTEVPASSGSSRRHSLPVVARSKLPEKSPKIQSNNNDHDPVLVKIQKPMVPEPGVRRASKTNITESTGFGRTISKMSLDMALRHMDIRQSMGGIRATSIFPHSIRSSAPKACLAHCSEPIVPVTNEELADAAGSCNKIVSEDGNGAFMENVDIAAKLVNRDRLVAKESDFDLYGSSRYDVMLLKEDLKNTNWLHNIEDKSDQSPVFDHRFESLPEPFSPL